MARGEAARSAQQPRPEPKWWPAEALGALRDAYRTRNTVNGKTFDQILEAVLEQARAEGRAEAAQQRGAIANAGGLDVEALKGCPSLMAILNRLGRFNDAWWDRLADEYARLAPQPSTERRRTVPPAESDLTATESRDSDGE